jgi:hypothetical protein
MANSSDPAARAERRPRSEQGRRGGKAASRAGKPALPVRPDPVRPSGDSPRTGVTQAESSDQTRRHREPDPRGASSGLLRNPLPTSAQQSGADTPLCPPGGSHTFPPTSRSDSCGADTPVCPCSPALGPQHGPSPTGWHDQDCVRFYEEHPLARPRGQQSRGSGGSGCGGPRMARGPQRRLPARLRGGSSPAPSSGHASLKGPRSRPVGPLRLP